MSAHDILAAAAAHMQDRAATYDKPEGERSMNSTVLAFAAVTGVLMTEEQGWLFMAMLKAARSQQGAYRADSYEDGAAYFALAGEAACRDRNGGWTPESAQAAAFPCEMPSRSPVMSDPLECAGCMSGCYRCAPASEQIARQVSGGTIDPFAGAPEWAKYKAQDERGAWYYYERRPTKGKALPEWCVSKGRSEPGDGPNQGGHTPQWRDTLITRN